MKSLLPALALLLLVVGYADGVLAQGCRTVGTVYLYPDDALDPWGPLPEPLHYSRETLDEIQKLKAQMSARARRDKTSLTRQYSELEDRVTRLRATLPSVSGPAELVFYGRAPEKWDRSKAIAYLKANPHEFGRKYHLWVENGRSRVGAKAPSACDPASSSSTNPLGGGAASGGSVSSGSSKPKPPSGGSAGGGDVCFWEWSMLATDWQCECAGVEVADSKCADPKPD